MLESSFEDVHATSRQAIHVESGSVKWHKVDFLVNEQVENLIESVRPTHLLHLAWCTEHGKYWSDSINHRWVESGLQMLRAFHNIGGNRAVIAGSCAEYEWNDEICSESILPNPATLYGQCKNKLRLDAEAFAEASSLSLAWARLFFMYGPHEDSRRLVPSAILSLLKNRSAKFTSGEQLRDFIFVEDAARAIVATLLSNFEGTLNVCSGKPMAIKEIVSLIADKLGVQDLVKFGALPTRPGDPSILVGDAGILSKDIGFTQHTSMNEAMERTICWWAEREGLLLPADFGSECHGLK